MSEQKFKVIVLTHDDATRLLEFLSALENVEIGGVFFETATSPQRTFKQKLERSVKYDGYLETFKKFSRLIFERKTESAKDEQTKLDRENNLTDFTRKAGIPFFKVENYHHETSLDLMRKCKADLGILYGTNIIKESVFSIPRLDSINLHQGFAPHYRGGPTVFWELFNGEKEVGITIHFVAPKVDTGDIILQKTLPLEYDFSRYSFDYESFLNDFRVALKEPSIKMIVEAVKQISAGAEQRKKQDTSLGKRYRLPVKSEKDELLRILKKRRKSAGL